jgi:polyisoprenoid-binding protein YceI
MRAPYVLLAIALAALSVVAGGAQTTRRDVDAGASKALFTVSHVYVEHVTGTVPILSGSVTLAQGSTIPTSVTAELDPGRMKTGDDDRDASLESPDWFDVKRYPKWTLASTKITPTSANTFTMEGLLTIHGVARPERLDVTVGGTPARPAYHATGTIDRHAFGMTVTRLDPVIGNPVDITLDVVLK